MYSEGHRPAGTFFLPALLIIVSVIMIDQYTKWLIMESLLHLEGKANPDFLNWFMTQNKIAAFDAERQHFKTLTLSPALNLAMVWNQGISFGIMNTGMAAPLIFIALSLLLSVGMIFWLVLNTKRMTALALGFIIGGALGNVIDRVRFDAVADFIDLHLGERHWPAFNIADSSIVFGAGLLMLASLFTPKEHKEKNL